MLSVPHMIVVFVLVLVIFGPEKLPELARGLGKLMAEFRKASTDFKGAFEQEIRDMERQAMMAERKKAADAAAAAVAAVPAGPATQATPAGTDTSPVEPPPGVPESGLQASEVLVATPVAEAVSRESVSTSADAAATAPPEAPSASASPVVAAHPTHDTPQPA
jgi:sec-independent protein translocase protein TatB